MTRVSGRRRHLSRAELAATSLALRALAVVAVAGGVAAVAPPRALLADGSAASVGAGLATGEAAAARVDERL